MNKKIITVIFMIAVLIPVLIWVSALVKCELLTMQYYDAFAHAHEQNMWLGDMEYFKVLSCDGETAEVYYVSQNRINANVLRFQKQDGAWVETGWTTIWSTTGSASEVVWPYWWHFIYGGI